ncbi:MAG: VOC family protein [bacterium]|nr:VOC family protein [bacterium]
MTAVQHIALNCIDRLAQEAFYTRHFGFRRARVFNAGQPGEFVMLRLGSCCIELFNNGAADPHAIGGEQPVGLKHLAFEVPDLAAAAAALQADGIKTGDFLDCSGIVPRMRVCFFRDPEGNILELMEGWDDEENPPQP